MAKATPNLSPEYAAKLALYERLVATNPAVERKGATMPYTSLNGHMFSVLDKNGTLALRLPAPERERFLSTYKTTLIEMYGMTMAEYVAVPDALLGKTSQLQPFFEASYRYVGSLKPKATTRPKKAGKAAKTAKGGNAAKAAQVGKAAKAGKVAKAARRAAPAKPGPSAKPGKSAKAVKLAKAEKAAARKGAKR